MRTKIFRTFFAFMALLCMPVTNSYAQTSIDARGSGGSGGSIIPGYDSRACTGTIAGAIRYSSASSCVEFCNGSSWRCPSWPTSSCNISVTSGLLARYSFDESSGAVAHESVSGHHAVVPSTATWAPSGGRIGGGVLFNGSSTGAISLGQNIISLNQFSFCFWFRKGVGSGPGSLVSTDWDRWRGLYINSAGTIVGLYINTSGTAVAKESTAVFAEGQWTHVCGTYDGTTNASGANIYRNGSVLAASWSQNGSGSTTSSGDGYFEIGGQSGGGRYVGHFDEVLVYNRALTGGEVTTIYNEYVACP